MFGKKRSSAGDHLSRLRVAILGLGVSVCLVGCSKDEEESSTAGQSTEEHIKAVVASEELLQKLTPKLKLIGAAMVSDQWDDLPEAIAGVRELISWGELNPKERWESASFGTVQTSMGEDVFTIKTKFEGVRRGSGERIVGVKASQKLRWEKSTELELGWKLVAWEPLEFAVEESPAPLFEDVLDKVIVGEDARFNARKSFHEHVLRSTLSEKTVRIGRYKVSKANDLESTFQYPTVSVMDFDGDGHEDFFLTSRWVRSQLFRNRGDGTFEDVTKESGLMVNGYVNTAVFADFDNDGDADALVGRSFEPAMYFRNDGGRFVDVTASLGSDVGKLFMVSSMAVTDVNRDGLLDVYMSTYNPTDIEGLKHQFLSPSDVDVLDFYLRKSSHFLDERGIGNMLFMNRGGGRLEKAGGHLLEIWRKSFQPLWFDADQDGDDDLYVCNDFAPDSFFRNDTPKGAADPVFVDAFKETFPDGKMAFGMGATCGDYDNDGDLDLFVSNMYSKAGNRIVPAFGATDPRILVAARGNFLYRNDNGVFHLANEAEGPETKVGWAFGGQFADFNNDGRLDLYVPSGLYTAPKEVATEVDL